MADTVNEELIRRVTAAESRLAILDARDRPETIAESFLKLNNLRGYWPLNTHRASGGANDQSGTGLNLTLNDDVQYAHSDWLTWATFDGATDDFYRADEAALDILGTEAYIAAADNGLTLGGWFWANSHTSDYTGLIAKWNPPGAQRSYGILLGTVANMNVIFDVSSNGVAVASVASPNNSLTLNTWWFFAGRFTPSTELKLWMNENAYTNVAAIPASIFNGGANFTIGYQSGASSLNGRAALCFLCASRLSDDVVEDLFERTRWLFGV